MKCKIFIDEAHEEEILIYAKKKTRLVEKVEQLVSEDGFEIMGYFEREAVKLEISDIYCFITENNKVFAVTEDRKLQLKQRLYQLEEKLPESFIKINQSCIANIKKIKRFNASIYGSLNVEFKNGYSDYVSRRNIKKIKERLGL